MAAEKIIGTTLTKTSGVSSVIADLTSVGEMGVESDEIETTTFDSEDGYKEFIPSLKDGGEVPIAGLVKSEANMEDMLGLAESQTTETWEVEFPSGAKWFFSAFVKMWKEGEMTVEGVRKFTGSLRITGKPIYAATGISA